MGIVRIIAGKYRGRKIYFPDVVGLRPTPDMVKETVFNWLNSYLIGAKCLDLFCGSGALSFEALSRGAKLVVAMESNKTIWRNLCDNAKLLQTNNFSPILGYVPKQLDLIAKHHTSESICKYDLVFLDPPFRKNLLLDTIEALETKHWLADDAILYVEVESEFNLSQMLETINAKHSDYQWKLLKNKISGQVQYSMIQKE